MATRGDLVNATDAVIYLRRHHGLRLSPATIRQWASRQKIGSYGLGRERYDLREIVRHAQERGLIRPR